MASDHGKVPGQKAGPAPVNLAAALRDSSRRLRSVTVRIGRLDWAVVISGPAEPEGVWRELVADFGGYG